MDLCVCSSVAEVSLEGESSLFEVFLSEGAYAALEEEKNDADAVKEAEIVTVAAAAVVAAAVAVVVVVAAAAVAAGTDS